MDMPHEQPGATVIIPAALRTRTGNRETVHVSGETVRHVIVSLDGAYQGLQYNLCHETGDLRPFVNIYVNGQNIRYLQGLDTSVPAGAVIHILQSVAGG